MPRQCSICAHRKRKEIDELLASGESYRNIAERFGTSKPALNRHKPHIAEAIAKATEAKAVEVVAHGEGLVAKLAKLEDEARRIGKLAEEVGDFKAALAAVKELVRMVELVAKAQGELGDGGTTVNVAVVQAPEWQELQGRIVAALAPYPEARAAVLEAIRG